MTLSKEEGAWKEVASTVAYVARTNLQRKKAEAEANVWETRRAILTAFQARMSAASRGSYASKSIADADLPAIAITVSHIAAFMWLEVLGDSQAFPISDFGNIDGCVVPVYTGFADVTVHILDHANSGTVLETFEECQCLVQFLISRDGKLGLEHAMHLQKRRNPDIDENTRRAEIAFWQVLVGGMAAAAPASLCKDVAAVLKEWQKAWGPHADMNKWDKDRFQRRSICKVLVDASELFKMLADAFSLHAENQDVWLDLEEKRLHKFSTESRKRPRKAEEDQGNGGGEEEDEEKAKLKEQVAAMAVALEKEKAALAALQGTFDTEVACQICLTAPRNVVLLPCRHGQFCSPCILKHQKVRNACPTCMTAIKTVITCVGS